MGTTHSRTANGSTHSLHSKGRRSFSKDSANGQLPTTASSIHLHPPSTSSTHSHPQNTRSRTNLSSHNGSSSPPASHIAPSPSSLHRAFGRRRSSNQTVESVSSSLGSATLCSNQSSGRFSGASNDTSCGASPSEEEFRWLHGRRYHNTTSLYMLPNDAEEVDRLHLQHYIFKMVMGGKNIHVPIPKESARVIDLGCGPATWTMDMATEMTTANFVGVDISPIFPAAIHPRNCSFYREDILQGISQPDNSFDVAYQRSVAPGFTLENWKQSVQEAFRVLKPGGWFESVESDVTVQDAGVFTSKCFELIQLSMGSRKVDPTVVRALDKLMVEAGFVDVQVKEYCVPLGEWGGKMGQLWKQNITAILDTAKPHLAKAGRISEQQVTEMQQSMAKETQNHRAFQIIYVTCGRKPL